MSSELFGFKRRCQDIMATHCLFDPYVKMILPALAETFLSRSSLELTKQIQIKFLFHMQCHLISRCQSIRAIKWERASGCHHDLLSAHSSLQTEHICTFSSPLFHLVTLLDMNKTCKPILTNSTAGPCKNFNKNSSLNSYIRNVSVCMLLCKVSVF